MPLSMIRNKKYREAVYTFSDKKIQNDLEKYVYAVSLFEIGNYWQSLHVFLSIENTEKISVNYHFYLSKIFYFMGDEASSVSHINNALAKNNHHPGYILHQYDIYDGKAENDYYLDRYFSEKGDKEEIVLRGILKKEGLTYRDVSQIDIDFIESEYYFIKKIWDLKLSHGTLLAIFLKANSREQHNKIINESLAILFYELGEKSLAYKYANKVNPSERGAISRGVIARTLGNSKRFSEILEINKKENFIYCFDKSKLETEFSKKEFFFYGVSVEYFFDAFIRCQSQSDEHFSNFNEILEKEKELNGVNHWYVYYKGVINFLMKNNKKAKEFFDAYKKVPLCDNNHASGALSFIDDDECFKYYIESSRDFWSQQCTVILNPNKKKCIVTSCDVNYLDKFVDSFNAGAVNNCEDYDLYIIVVNPDKNLNYYIEKYRKINFISDSIDSGRNIKSYYALSRFKYLVDFLLNYEVCHVCDIDSFFVRSLSSVEEEFSSHDIGVRKINSSFFSHNHYLPWHYYSAAFVSFAKTKNGFIAAKMFNKMIDDIYDLNLKNQWWIDQTMIWCIIEFLKKVDGFKLFDYKKFFSPGREFILFPNGSKEDFIEAVKKKNSKP